MNGDGRTETTDTAGSGGAGDTGGTGRGDETSGSGRSGRAARLLGVSDFAVARPLGVVVLTGLTAVLVLATSRVPARDGPLPAFLETLSVAAVAPVVPPFVYTYALLGSLGYVFTKMYKKDTGDWQLGQWSVRLVAALPVAVGTFLLAGLLLPEGLLQRALDPTGDGGGATGALGAGGPRRVLAGLAFVSGLFVDTAYERLDMAARRLLGGGADGRADGDATGDSGADTTTATGDADDTAPASEQTDDPGDRR